MKIIIKDSYDEISRVASEILIEDINLNPDMTLGLATGATPLRLYEYLINAYKESRVSFKDITTFNLDEYIGIDQNHHQSYYFYMQENLFKHIDFSYENINFPENEKGNLEEEIDNYNNLLKEKGIDVQVLGIGANGHIGFNEPGTPMDNEVFIVSLDEQTRKDNSKYFDHLDQVPKKAITMGIKNIMTAKKIVLIASGKQKAKAIYDTLYGKIDVNNPASILQLHPNCYFILDKDAASLIKENNIQ